MVTTDTETWMQQIGASTWLKGLQQLYPSAAMFVVNAERAIVHWSPGAETLLGYSVAEAEGAHCRKVNRCMECMAGCALTEQRNIHQQTLTMYTDDQRQIQVHKQGVAFFDEEDVFLGGIEWLSPTESATSIPAPQVNTPAEPTHPPNVSAPTPTTVPPSAPVTEELIGPITPDPLIPIPRPSHLWSDDGFEKLGHLVTRAASMREVFETIRNISETEATVLIHGESGTGKELVARAIHNTSPRRSGPFVAVNCAALAPQLLESELFGHVKGAFTGAISPRIGLFQQANQGTIFLDEIAELPMDLQSKLLRVLEEREVIPVGTSTPTKVDIRVLSASFQSLPERVQQGSFRQDLMYRLRVVPLSLPPLRERQRDIELLVWHFIDLYNQTGPRHIQQIDPVAWNAIKRYPWPGNVRELKNCIEYAFAVGRGITLLPKELPHDLLALPKHYKQKVLSQFGPKETDSDTERQQIAEALEASHGHIGQAAKILGTSRATLWRKRKKYGI